MDIIKPGQFAHDNIFHNYIIPADTRRDEFDRNNETLLRLGKKPNFVFLGDSITQGYDVNTYFGDNSFVINRGIGGDVPMYILRRLDADVIQLKPDHCVLLAGVNEIWCLDKKFDSAELYNEAYERTKGFILDYIKKIINRCKEVGQSLIVCSITPTYKRGETLGKDANELIIECNKAIKQMTEESGFIFVNYHPHFCAEDGKSLSPDYAADGVHLKSAGYDVMSAVLKEALAQNGIKI